MFRSGLLVEKDPPKYVFESGSIKITKSEGRKQASHFIQIAFATFTVILVSICTGVFLGPPDSNRLAEQIVALAVIHSFIFYTTFKRDFEVRLNPYVTITTWVSDALRGEEQRVHFFFTELGAQAVGATGASAIFYALISSGMLPFVGQVSVQNTLVGWAFLIEIVASGIMSWTFFQKGVARMSMAHAVSVSAALVYPFIGTTTHSPFRWLANCIPSGACNTNYSWIFPVAPLGGIILGHLLSLV